MEIKILNLSKHKLLPEEISILEKGLKFTPTPIKKDLNEINKDLNEFTRKFRLAEYFHGTEDRDISIVRDKSNWTPPLGRSQALDNFVKSVNEIPLNTIEQTQNIKHNITIKERQGIKSLSQDNSIIIKEADKGGATVIMNSSHYQAMAEHILNDESYYKKLDIDPQKTDRITYNKVLMKHKSCFTEKELKYLKDHESKPSQFYGLPKVHKSKIIKRACETTNNSVIELEEVDDLVLRPIIAGPICLTSRLSNFIDILLKPFVKYITSYLKDTTDFLRQLPKTTEENTILVSFDVESLYSNISHDLGLEAIQYWLETYQNELPSRFTKAFIIDGIEFIIRNNTFQFNNNFYLQIKGTAMGTKVAPTYATLTLGYLERTLYRHVSSIFGMEFGLYFEKMWKRFLDDCFILWTRTNEDLQTLKKILNSLHKDINFTVEKNETSLPFLDCQIIKDNTNLETDIYYKPTDSKMYLMFNSCHPRHTKISIPFSLSRRLRTIISKDEIFNKRALELQTYLKRQKYPTELIKNGIEKARSLNRNNLLAEINEKNEDKIIPYVSTFNPRNPEVYSQLQHDITLLKRDPHMQTILKDYTFIKSKRQLPNLKRLLTKAKFQTHESIPKITKCGRSNCGLCSNLVEGQSYKSKSGHTFKVKFPMSCDVKNIVYLLICNGCKEEYIGETNDLRKRMTVHRQHIRDPRVRILKVSEHIDSCCRKEPKFNVFPIFKMNSDSVAERRLKERQLIQLIKPKLN